MVAQWRRLRLAKLAVASDQPNLSVVPSAEVV